MRVWYIIFGIGCLVIVFLVFNGGVLYLREVRMDGAL